MNENNALEGFIPYCTKGILNLFGLMKESFHYPNEKERVPLLSLFRFIIMMIFLQKYRLRLTEN